MKSRFSLDCVLVSMPNPAKASLGRKTPSILILGLLLLLWSVGWGWGVSQIARSQVDRGVLDRPHIGTVDPIPERFRAGQQLYLEHCATCHVGIPPAVLPTETWRELLLDEEHYGTRVEVLPSPQIYIVWDYLQTFSRPKRSAEETIPYRLEYSTYFQALHPEVEVPRPIDIKQCGTCHPNAVEFDFRSLVRR